MENQQEATGSRVSKRSTKGIPPKRLGHEAPSEMVSTSEKSRRSMTSTAAARKELEAKRAAEITALKCEYADKQKARKNLETRIRRQKRILDNMKTDGEPAESLKKHERDIDNLSDELEMLMNDLESFESTYKDKIEVIQLQIDAELENVESDVDSMHLESDEEEMSRVDNWVQTATSHIDNEANPTTTEVRNPTTSTVVNNMTGESHVTPPIMSRVEADMRPFQKPCADDARSGYYSPQPTSNQFEDNRRRRMTEDCNTGGAHGPTVSANVNSDVNMVSQLVSALAQAFGDKRTEAPRFKMDKNLPKFDGNPADWENFRSEYERTTTRYKFEESENLIRLRTSLEGDALHAVKHLMANPRNIEKIWEVLKKRFGRPEFVLDHLVERAKATKSPDPAKPETIIDFGTAIDALVTNICAYNHYDYMCNRQLVNELVRKLPTTLKTQWNEWILEDPVRVPHLNHFAKWLSRKVDAAILCLEPKSQIDSKEEFKRGRNRARGSVNSSAAGSEERENCPACGKKNHNLKNCWALQKMKVDERWEVVKKARACITCLNVGHRSRECPDSSKCPKDGCGRWHHQLLHSEGFAKKSRPPTRRNENGQEQNLKAVVADEHAPPGAANASVIKGLDGPLQIIPVKLKKKSGGGHVLTYALLDGGATRSLILKSLAEELGIDGAKQEYCYSGINGQPVIVNDSMKIDCDTAGVYTGSKFQKVTNCVTVDNINIRPYSFDMDEAKRNWPHLRNVRGATLTDVVPSIVIGNNNPELLIPNRVLRGTPGTPVALRTVLGWTVCGNFDVIPGQGKINVTTCGEEATDDYLHNMIKSWFTTDNFGVKPSKTAGNNLKEKRAWKILQETTKKIEGGWQTGLLWSEDNVQIEDGEFEAMNRLYYTERKMKDPMFRQKYMDKISEYLQKGYLRKLTPEEAALRPPHTRYIPHFGQVNPNKPDKFRFILDAKAKVRGTSLNDKLLKGPDLIRPLTSVLMNFRIHRIALTGDIADMFHRIRIQEEDKCSQRILWREGDSSREADHYQMEVMIFGATSSPASAIYVKNRNAEEFISIYPKAVDAIKQDFYVDDCLTGGNTDKEVTELRQQISIINDSGGFKVCKFMSNSADVLDSIPTDLLQNGAMDIRDKEDTVTERVLGLWWDPKNDIFSFKLNMHKVKHHVLNGEVPTKREMCGLIMSVYDPLGFVAQFKVKGLMILQDVWRSGIGWDDQIPQDINVKWQRWMSMLPLISEIKVPRFYSPLLFGADEVQLHTFQDASEESFSAVCYLRIRMGDNIDVALLLAKAKVAPLKKLTIPRLELQAAVLGTRMATTLREELRLSISSRWFWSDSRTVLCWIRSQGARYKEFVANRIGEIQEDSNASEWHWVPTKLNVADQATRFESEVSFDPSSEWYTGPEFLKLDTSEFPREREEGTITNVNGYLEEDTGAVASLCDGSRLVSHETSVLERLQSVIPSPLRFSSYLRLLRATAAIIQCSKYWMKKVRGEVCERPWKSEVSNIDAENVLAAERSLVRLAQLETYPEEFVCLVSGNRVSKKSCIWRLEPFLGEDGVLRVEGRLGASSLSEEVKHPIILPPRHYITELIIDWEHVKFAHNGKDTVLTSLRQKFWIPDGRAAVQRSWSRCQICRLRKAKPIPPRMGNLPFSRLAVNQPPFTFTGLDFFGPMTVLVGRRVEKRWGAFFCCQATRAVHLELCSGLSTDEAIMAISRFVDTRGRPRVIISDNGTNFVGAARELKENLRHVDFEKLKSLGKFHEIKWIFNPPAAPHMGGSWERLVQSVKKSLHSVLRKKTPKDSTLITLLKSVENMLNSRPITHVSPDAFDPEPLTPNHILRGTVDIGPGIPAQMDASVDYLRSQWRRAQLLADEFWARWSREFLPKLLQREKWLEKAEPLQIGDLVFILDDQLPRNCWIRGYISSTFPGADGQVRRVRVTTKDNNKKEIVYERPATKICPLGLRMEIQDLKVPKFGAGNVSEAQAAPSNCGGLRRKACCSREQVGTRLEGKRGA